MTGGFNIHEVSQTQDTEHCLHKAKKGDIYLFPLFQVHKQTGECRGREACSWDFFFKDRTFKVIRNQPLGSLLQNRKSSYINVHASNDVRWRLYSDKLSLSLVFPRRYSSCHRSLPGQNLVQATERAKDLMFYKVSSPLGYFGHVFACLSSPALHPPPTTFPLSTLQLECENDSQLGKTYIKLHEQPQRYTADPDMHHESDMHNKLPWQADFAKTTKWRVGAEAAVIGFKFSRRHKRKYDNNRNHTQQILTRVTKKRMENLSAFYLCIKTHP